MCQDVDLFKSLVIRKFHEHAKTVLNVVRHDSNIGLYCERHELSY